MSRVTFVATAGAGGDPAAACGRRARRLQRRDRGLQRRDRGHETRFVGDQSVQRLLRPIGIETETLPPELPLADFDAAAGRSSTATMRGGMA